MQEKMERMRAVRLLEWEHKRLQMFVKFPSCFAIRSHSTREAEDMRIKLKDIQMLKVKRNIEADVDDHAVVDKIAKNIAAQKAVSSLRLLAAV